MYLLGMLSGTMTAYIIGTVWFMYIYKMGLWETLTICVFPFVIWDAAKMIVIMLIGPVIKKQLIRQGSLS